MNNKLSFSQIYSTSLTIFAMLFGAGNLVLPPALGMACGDKVLFGLSGFLLTGVLVPFLGLIAIILFNGNYAEFFGRIGKIPGFIITFLCMLMLGPLLIMPRIVTLSYAMLLPFMPTALSSLPEFSSRFIFSLFFLSLAFLATYKPSRILGLVGKVLSPIKVLCIITIILIGIFSGNSTVTVPESTLTLFSEGMKLGYQTVDLLGTLFFGSIIISLLLGDRKATPILMKSIMKTTMISGILACSFLTLIYTGMSYLGVFHGVGLNHLDESQLFSQLCFRILGYHGAALIGFTVFLACFITAIALTAVVGEYTQKELFLKKISYPAALLLVLTACLVPSLYGFAAVVSFSKPLLFIMYPIVLAITLCNLLYKVYGIKTIKLPVALVALIVIGYNMYEYKILMPALLTKEVTHHEI